MTDTTTIETALANSVLQNMQTAEAAARRAAKLAERGDTDLANAASAAANALVAVARLEFDVIESVSSADALRKIVLSPAQNATRGLKE